MGLIRQLPSEALSGNLEVMLSFSLSNSSGALTSSKGASSSFFLSVLFKAVYLEGGRKMVSTL